MVRIQLGPALHHCLLGLAQPGQEFLAASRCYKLLLKWWISSEQHGHFPPISAPSVIRVSSKKHHRHQPHPFSRVVPHHPAPIDTERDGDPRPSLHGRVSDNEPLTQLDRFHSAQD